MSAKSIRVLTTLHVDIYPIIKSIANHYYRLRKSLLIEYINNDDKKTINSLKIESIEHSYNTLK